jgi:GntR family transcriptional regulator
MEFNIEKHSSSSAIRQIQEQIKLAVSMGVLRRGDTLPSIRDVEKQTGINRGLVHKAYLSLRKSGLLTLARGKGTVISTDAPAPPPVSEKFRQWSIEIVSKARQKGLAPTAFARYLSHHAQEVERMAPFIVFIENDTQDATARADVISQTWQVPVASLTIPELKNAVRDGLRFGKVLTNHFLYDRVKSLLSGRKIDVIPITTRGSERTKKALAGIKANSSVLIIIPPGIYAHAPFIVAQLPKFFDSRGVKVSHRSARDISNFEELFRSSQYDQYLLSHGTHGIVPKALRANPRILLMHMELDPVSVEAARIRAGVLI